MTRMFGYSKQTILKFNKDIYDYWENNIKKQMKTMEHKKMYMQPMRELGMEERN